MAFLWHAPVTPSMLYALQRDRAAKPLQPTSIGTHQARHPRLRHSSTKLPYLARFLSFASSMRSSQGTVSSSRTTCFVESENRTMSGLRVVSTMCSGNLSCFPRSAFICQSDAVPRSPAAPLGLGLGFSPARMKAIACLAGRRGLFWVMLVKVVSAIAFSTWSWRQV